MMMPANYSVVAENEMTYVTGGGVIANVLPAIMTESNWKNFTTNLVMIVGNGFMGNFLKSTVETLFSSNYEPLDVVTGIGSTLLSTVTGGTGKMDGVSFTSVVRTGLQILGGAAAVYSLGKGEVGMALPKDYVMPIA